MQIFRFPNASGHAPGRHRFEMPPVDGNRFGPEPGLEPASSQLVPTSSVLKVVLGEHPELFSLRAGCKKINKGRLSGQEGAVFVRRHTYVRGGGAF